MSSERCECEAEEKARHVLEKIAERRSIRSFTDKPVSSDDLKRLVTAAKWAALRPSLIDGLRELGWNSASALFI